MDGDVLLFGGAYSNLQATEALVGEAERRGISSTNIICTGDLVAYCADPTSVCDLLVDRVHCVAGNCERQIAEGASDCGCGFSEGTACDLASRGWYPYASQRLDGYLDSFRDLPDAVTFMYQDARYVVIHGGFNDISRFIWPSDAEGVFEREISAIERETGPINAVVAGHSGLAFQRQIGSRLWINAGVIGMPPHDGRPQTRYAVLSPDGVRFHALTYDYEAAAQALINAGLTQGYEKALVSGYWPAEDILPRELRR